MYQQQQQPPSSSSSPQKSNLPSGLTRFWIDFTLATSTALLRGLILNHLRADLQAHGAGSLVRQRSSPAGFLSHLANENGGQEWIAS
ncbi:hypothetical protein OIU74_008102 [Salix koriyanagi]|uniref:Uncharacterized protein n=1 Tax=Salix koriyanagi TaxID=2511006 RepID=A0A9Q0U5A0_9ROSI|nr:hypothetical protein OIU74_008102 [Salix koriyanagi]